LLHGTTDLFEKVDGTNTYEILFDLALDIKPTLLRKKECHNHATSFVLRTFEDKFVVQMPSEEQINKVKSIFPDIRLELFDVQGKKLSDILQDNASYCYGWIHLGGSST